MEMRRRARHVPARSSAQPVPAVAPAGHDALNRSQQLLEVFMTGVAIPVDQPCDLDTP